MSLEELVAKGATAAAKAVDGHADEWVHKALTEAYEAADELPPGLERTAAIAGLAALERVEVDVVTAGKVWVIELLARFGAGRLSPDDLRLIARSSYEERRAAHQGATAAAHADYLVREEARRRLLRAIADVGAFAARAALPLLIAAAGL